MKHLTAPPWAILSRFLFLAAVALGPLACEDPDPTFVFPDAAAAVKDGSSSQDAKPDGGNVGTDAAAPDAPGTTDTAAIDGAVDGGGQ